MAGAIAIAAVLAARLVKIVCPHCGQIQRVERKSVAYRLCSRCRAKFPDPVAARRR
jgi:ribosomal protein L37AE/L43A